MINNPVIEEGVAAWQMLSGHGPIPNGYALNKYFFPS